MFFSFFYKPYIAIIGDIKKSRKITDRNVVQTKLKAILEEINLNYQDDISSKFLITLGDEFQGLLCSGANALRIVSEIERGMYPTRIRFGIGIGEITTEINNEFALGADGPAYYNARLALNNLKENEKKRKTTSSDIRIETEGENEAPTVMMNTILSLLAAMKEEWTERQREIIWDLMEHRDGQVQVANRFHISQPVVGKILAGGKYYAYQEGMDAISKALEEVKGEDHV